MRAVIQRVKTARVRVDDVIVGEIGKGLVVLLGVGHHDSEEDARYIADKLSFLRIFEDAEGKMNLSVRDIEGSVLVVSQFTLFADCRKGRRPSFVNAGDPERAQRLYKYVIGVLNESGVPTAEGIFQASMEVELINEGPVTILLDSKKEF